MMLFFVFIVQYLLSSYCLACIALRKVPAHDNLLDDLIAPTLNKLIRPFDSCKSPIRILGVRQAMTPHGMALTVCWATLA